MKNKTVMIVNAYGRSNRGDSVLLDECIDEIRAALPGTRIVGALFEGRPAAEVAHPEIVWTDRIGNTNLRGPAAKLVTLFRLVIAALATLPLCACFSRLLPPAQRQTWHEIRSAALVVSAPGGYIHDTNFAFYVALLHIWLGSRAGVRVVMAPQSVGPIDGRFARRVARFALAAVSVICARESYSYAFLTGALGLASKQVVRSGDSAFWNSNVASDPMLIAAARAQIGLNELHGRRIFGITVVDWNFPKSADPVSASHAYVVAMAQIIDHIAQAHNLQPVIFNQVTDDLGMAERVAGAASSSVLIDRVSREPEILRALISESSLFLGTRFHSCIFAMMAGCPTFAIAYLPKTSFILRDLKLEHRQVSIDDICPEVVTTQLSADFRAPSDAQAEIQDAVETYRQTHARLRDFLAGEP